MAKDNINDIEKSVEKLSETLENLSNTLKPLTDFGNLEDSIEKLKNVVPTSNPNKDETDIIDDRIVLNVIFQTVKDTPNDTELGTKIRGLCNVYDPSTYNTEE